MIWSDPRTGLMWAKQDNGEDVYWANARNYCENYSVAGVTGWRMPTQNELAGLYASDAHFNKIKITGWVWASETRGAEAAAFSFYSGTRNWGLPGKLVSRALPVRSGK